MSVGVPADACVPVCDRVHLRVCTRGSLLAALVTHNVTVALETAFLSWHAWGQGGMAGCDMTLCGL